RDFHVTGVQTCALPILIGTAPPVCFAIFGLLTPLFERRLGLERVTVIALTAIALGLVLRGFSTDAASLLLTTALIFAGVGMGNKIGRASCRERGGSGVE